MTTFLTFQNRPDERHPVTALEGHLRLGHPWELDLVLPAGPREPLPGEEASLTLPWEGDTPSRFQGLVSQVEIRKGAEPLWNLRLASPLWRLSLAWRSRVFVDRSPRQILEEVLGSWGFPAGDPAIQVSGEAWERPRPLACQFRESDLDFLRRWCAHGCACLSAAGSGGDPVRILALRDLGDPEVPAGALRGFRRREGRFEGEGAGPTLVPGARLSLPDHPLWPGEYRITEVDLPAPAASPLCRFRALAAPIQALPQPAPWPSLRGVLRARVEGPPLLDPDGRRRHRLRLPFDARAEGPLPLAPLAVPGSAHDLPLDPGTEVVLAFEGGDPDRPVICGVLPAGPMDPAERERPALQGPGGTRVAFPGPQDDTVSLEGPAATLALGPQGWDLGCQGSSLTVAGFLSDQAEGFRLKTHVGGVLVAGGLVETDTAHVNRLDLSVAPSVRFHAADAWQWGRMQLIAGRSLETGLRHEKSILESPVLPRFVPPTGGPGGSIAHLLEVCILPGRSFHEREIIAPTFAAYYQTLVAGYRKMPQAQGDSPFLASVSLLEADGARPAIFLGSHWSPSLPEDPGAEDIHLAGCPLPAVRGPVGRQRRYDTRFHILPRTLSLEHQEALVFKLDAQVPGQGSIAMVAHGKPFRKYSWEGPRRAGAGLLMSQGGVRLENLAAMLMPQLRLEAKLSARPVATQGLVRLLADDRPLHDPSSLPPRPSRRGPRIPELQSLRGLPPELVEKIAHAAWAHPSLDGLPYPDTLCAPGEEATLDLWAGEEVHVHLDPGGVEARLVPNSEPSQSFRVGATIAFAFGGLPLEPGALLSLEAHRLRLGFRNGEDMACGMTLSPKGLRFHGQGFLEAEGILRVQPRPGHALILEG